MKNTEGGSIFLKRIVFTGISFLFCTILTVNIIPKNLIKSNEEINTQSITYIENSANISTENLLTEYYNGTESSEIKVAEVTTTSRSSDIDRTTAVQDPSTIDIVEENYISIDEVTISKDMDLTVRTGLSKEEFKTLVANTKADTTGFFYENSDLIYDLCEKYELNEIFFCGVMAGESGWNIASNHRRTYNYISLMSNGKLKQFSSVEDGLEQAAKALHNNYLKEGGKFYSGKTLSGVQKRFCPNSSTWVNLIYTCMSKMI